MPRTCTICAHRKRSAIDRAGQPLPGDPAHAGGLRWSLDPALHPHGQQGHFFKAWEGEEDWERIEVPASDCPRISPAFLQSERAALGRSWFSQEYECQFMETIDAVFRMEDIRRSITDEVKPLFETPPDDDYVKPLELT